MNNRTLLVWDSVGKPPKGCSNAVLWRGFATDGEACLSMPEEVEARADLLRDRFLGWIHDLGEAKIDGESLIDRLSLRPDFSYWWMTLLAEKSYDKSAGLYDAVKMLALEDLVRDRVPERVVLVSHDRTLARTFYLWCRNSGLELEWKKTEGSKEGATLLRRAFRGLPRPLQAAAHLMRWIVERWPLREKRKSVSSDAEVTFVDYLVHLRPDAQAKGHFGTNYWTDLVNVLRENKMRVNWLHHYVRHDAVCSTRRARRLLKRFNEGDSKGMQRHMSLDGALSISVIMKTIRDFCRVAAAGLRSRGARSHFKPAGSNVDLWPLFGRDWRDSFYGATAILNCLFLNLLETAIGGLGHQRLGVYLLENQGWEMAFIHAWRAAGHGKLIGVQHATMRFWDMRYFHDSRSYEAREKNGMPMPDLFAINGPVSQAACHRVAYPKERIVEVEALRYLYLGDLTDEAGSAGRASDRLRVLVFGDYVPAVNRRQMDLLADATKDLHSGVQFIVKPHPACAFDTSDYPSMDISITNSPLADLLRECDVAFTGHITSAAVDAYIAGLPVVSLLDGDMFNMSPLRGLEGVAFVTGSDDLARALCEAAKGKGRSDKDFYCLDKALGRWKGLLSANAYTEL